MTLFKWHNDINKSLQTGKGRYKYSLLTDIHKELKLLKLIQKNQWSKAIKHYVQMEEIGLVPWVVITFLEKKIREAS